MKKDKICVLYCYCRLYYIVEHCIYLYLPRVVICIGKIKRRQKHNEIEEIEELYCSSIHIDSSTAFHHGSERPLAVAFSHR
jgi:hypothetical protein